MLHAILTHAVTESGISKIHVVQVPAPFLYGVLKGDFPVEFDVKLLVPYSL